MSWIKTIAYHESAGRLRALYERVKGPQDNIDNIMLAHSLRPHTMEAHMALYKQVLHHNGNTLPRCLLETIGVWVSLINRCQYCVEHHFGGLERLLKDDERAGRIRDALAAGDLDAAVFDAGERLALEYAEVLTRDPSRVDASLIERLRSRGFDDGQILEINQVAAYFNYANRTVLGLGISTDGDILGLSPDNAENPEDWTHG